MIVLLYVLICITSFILVGLVLMQDSKSGLGGITGGATMNTFGGNTDKALVKATAVTATVFFVLILISLVFNQKPKASSLIESADKVQIDATLKDSSSLDKGSEEETKAVENNVEAEANAPTGAEAVIPIPTDASETPENPVVENAEATTTEPKADAPVEAPQEEPAKDADDAK